MHTSDDKWLTYYSELAFECNRAYDLERAVDKIQGLKPHQIVTRIGQLSSELLLSRRNQDLKLCNFAQNTNIANDGVNCVGPEACAPQLRARLPRPPLQRVVRRFPVLTCRSKFCATCTCSLGLSTARSATKIRDHNMEPECPEQPELSSGISID